MCIRIVTLALAVAILVLHTHAQDYTKLVFRDCGSKGVDIQNVDMKPMPIFNPGAAFFTFVATLKRPVSKSLLEFLYRNELVHSLFFYFRGFRNNS
jgi:hypothetical protein